MKVAEMAQEQIFDSNESLDAGGVSEEEMSQLTSLPLSHKFSCSTTCPFSEDDYSKSDADQRSKSAIKLWGLMLCCTVVMVIEVVGGLKANSLAILTDAAHMLSDVAGFAISLFAVWMSGWKATPNHSFGYNRVEVVGVLLSVQLIWLMSISLIYEAIKRLIMKETKVDGRLMFGIATFGLVVNVSMALWLGHDHHSHHGHSHHGHSHSGHAHHDCEDGDHNHEHNHNHNHEHEALQTGDEENAILVSTPQESRNTLSMNIRGAYLHIICDCLQSVAAMIAGVIIWIKPEWLVADLLCTLLFTTVALVATLPMLKDILYVLMERAPSDVDTASLESGLKLVKGVRGVHDLHTWAITSGKRVLSCHVVTGAEASPHEILHDMREYCEKTFKIHHVTIQIEQEA